MSTSERRRRVSAARLGAAVLSAAATLALAGCGADYASSEPVAAADYHARHPIVLAEAPTGLDVYPIGDSLDSQSISNIRAFAERYRKLGSGRIAILTPANGSASGRAVADIRRTLSGAGLRGQVAIASYAVGDPSRASPIRLAFVGLKAKVPSPCGQWPADITSGTSLGEWKNESYWNFGCATQSVLAAQVDDPRDFVQARATEAPDVEMRLRAIGDVRKGQDPGTDWKTQNSSIGQVGGN